MNINERKATFFPVDVSALSKVEEGGGGVPNFVAHICLEPMANDLTTVTFSHSISQPH